MLSRIISKLFRRKPQPKSLAEFVAEDREAARIVDDFLNDENIPPEVAKSYVDQMLNARQISEQVSNDPELASSLTGMQPGACVYLMKRKDGAYKIGMSNSPVRRLGELKKILPSLEPVHYILCETRKDAYRAEQKLHKEYSEYRLDGEFFKLPPQEVDQLKAIFWYKGGNFYYPLFEYQE